MRKTKKVNRINTYNRKQNTIIHKVTISSIALITVLLTLTTCKPMFLQDIAGYVPVYSQVVGPDGGTVTDSRGASVEIPAGALAEATTITIATYENGSGIYSRHGVTPFTGGADFGPDGTEFLKPVTITLPTARKMVPGQTQPLFMLDPGNGAWEMTDFTLTAAEGGYSATAEVTHFTPYVSSLLPPGALSKIEEFFDGTNGQVALGSYMAWFLTATNLYGYTTECGNSVYEVVGLFFDFTWQVDGVPGTAVSQYGDVSLDTVAQLNYSYDTASTDGPEYTYNMLVTVYFDVTENPPEAEANISILEPVPGSTVEGIETISTYIITGGSDTDIDSVAFYADGGLLGSDDEAPFQWYWDTGSLADGEHTLTATAAFSGGESVESEGVTVVVGESGTVAAPVFDPPAGEVAAGTEVAITCSTNGATIYYTRNGATPDETSGTHYTAPIIIDAETTLSAIAVKEGLADSTVTVGAYTISETTDTTPPELPDYSGVICITTTEPPDGINIRWYIAEDDTDIDPSYKLYRSTSNELINLQAIDAGAGTLVYSGSTNDYYNNGWMLFDGTSWYVNYPDTGLEWSTVYYYNVVVTDDTGNQSIYINGQSETGSEYWEYNIREMIDGFPPANQYRSDGTINGNSGYTWSWDNGVLTESYDGLTFTDYNENTHAGGYSHTYNRYQYNSGGGVNFETGFESAPPGDFSEPWTAETTFECFDGYTEHEMTEVTFEVLSGTGADTAYRLTSRCWVNSVRYPAGDKSMVGYASDFLWFETPTGWRVFSPFQP